MTPSRPRSLAAIAALMPLAALMFSGPSPSGMMPIEPPSRPPHRRKRRKKPGKKGCGVSR